jgi:hypothetical protein
MQLKFAQCSPRLLGEKLRRSHVPEWHNSSKRTARTWEMVKEVVVQGLRTKNNVEKV